MDNDMLIADEGYVYTNGETAGGIVALGIYDHPSNWWQIPLEEWKNKSIEEENKDEQ